MIIELMAMTRTYWRTALGAGFVGMMYALLLLASPLLSAMASDRVAYADMNDAELTQALQTWGTLQSSDRRELLVELKKRMARSQALPSQGSAPPRAQTRAPQIRIYIHVRKSMRFGAGINTGVDRIANNPVENTVDNHIGNRRSGGVVVMRGGVQGIGDARLAAQEILNYMRSLIANSQPLPGPGFGHGFERRQAFLRASFGGNERLSGGAYRNLRGSGSALKVEQRETHLRDD